MGKEEEREPTFEELVEQLKDEDGKVREEAMKALGRVEDERVKIQVRTALRAINYLTNMMRVEGNLRHHAYKTIEQLRSIVDLEPLIQALKSENEEKYSRKEASYLLGRLGGERVVDALFQLLIDKDTDSYARSIASKCLRDLGVFSDKRVVEQLIQTLKDEDGKVREEVVKILGNLEDKQDLESLIQALKNETKFVREYAVEALGKLGDIRAVEPLIQALKDEDGKVREEAVKALGIGGDKRAIEPLFKVLQEDEDKRVREEVVKILGNLEDKQDLESLIQALKNETKFVREYAVEALGKLGNIRAVEPLIQTLKDEDWKVRKQAVLALGKFDSKKCTTILQEHLMNDQDRVVRKTILLELAKKEDYISVELVYLAQFDSDSLIQRAAKEAIQNMPVEITDKIRNQIGEDELKKLEINAQLKDENWEIRRSAIRKLGELGDTHARELLIKALKDKSHYVREDAAWALGRLGDPRAIEPLIQALKDEDYDVRDSAREALERLSESPVPLWIQELKNENQELRGATKDWKLIHRLYSLRKHKDREIREVATEIWDKLGFDSLKVEYEDFPAYFGSDDEKFTEEERKILREAESVKYKHEYSAQINNLIELATEEQLDMWAKLNVAYYLLKKYVEQGITFAIAPYIKISSYMVSWDDWDDDDEPEEVLRGFPIDTIEGDELRNIMNLLDEDVNSIIRYAFYALGSIGDRRAAKVVITNMRVIERWETNWPEYVEAVGSLGDWDYLEIGLSYYEFFDIIMKLDAIEEFVEIFKDAPTFFISVFMEIVEHYSYKEVKRFFDCLKDDPDYLIEILMGYMLHFVHLDKLAEGLRSLREDIVSLKQSILEEKLKLELEIILKRLDETEKEKDEREKEEEEFINLMQKKIDDFQKSKGVKRAQILEEIYIFLQSDNTTEILHALCALGKLQLSETTERILPLLEHWDRYIQRETIESLAKIGSAKAREPLNNLLEKETNSLTRGRILEARGRIWEALYRPKD